MTHPASPGPAADEFRLDGYVALVTGAGRGIGAGIAQAYARAGADLVLVARTVADLRTVAASVQSLGRTALVIPADLTTTHPVATIIDHAIAEYGRLDILVNNAGGSDARRLPRHHPGVAGPGVPFQRLGPFELTRQATPHLIDSGRGSVITITQIVAATPLHRLATVADVANTARWLASPAASYLTGKIIELDGGAEAPVFPAP